MNIKRLLSIWTDAEVVGTVLLRMELIDGLHLVVGLVELYELTRDVEEPEEGNPCENHHYKIIETHVVNLSRR